MIAALRGNAVMPARGEIDVDCFCLGGKVPIWHDQPRYGVEAAGRHAFKYQKTRHATFRRSGGSVSRDGQPNGIEIPARGTLPADVPVLHQAAHVLGIGILVDLQVSHDFVPLGERRAAATGIGADVSVDGFGEKGEHRMRITALWIFPYPLELMLIGSGISITSPAFAVKRIGTRNRVP